VVKVAACSSEANFDAARLIGFATEDCKLTLASKEWFFAKGGLPEFVEPADLASRVDVCCRAKLRMLNAYRSILRSLR
jgi:hypothetical protein